MPSMRELDPKKMVREEEDYSNPRKRRRTMDVNWSELPNDVLIRMIENHLLSVEDFIMTSLVCHSWHRAATACDLERMRGGWTRQTPRLMLTDGNMEIFGDELDQGELTTYEPGELDNIKDDENNVEEQTEFAEFGPNNLHRRNFLNLALNKCYTLDCPNLYGKACWGSPCGWIVTSGLGHKMYMFNPLTKTQLTLPSRRTLPGLWKESGKFMRAFFIEKAIVLKVPSVAHDTSGCGNGNETLLTVVFYDGDNYRAALAKPGDKQWTPIEGSSNMIKDITGLTDVLYHNDHGLLFVGMCGRMLYCDLHDNELAPVLEEYRPSLRLRDIVDNVFNREYVDSMTYIVEYGHDLLMVLRIIALEKDEDERLRDDDHDIDHYKTVDFKVYRLNFHTKEWKELQNLQDVSLFVGNSTTMAVCASQSGFEPNCIYFTDDYRDEYSYTKHRLGGHDMGVFKLDDKSIHPLSVGNNMKSSYCCPFWFVPML